MANSRSASLAARRAPYGCGEAANQCRAGVTRRSRPSSARSALLHPPYGAEALPLRGRVRGFTEAGASSPGLARRPRNGRSNRRVPRSGRQGAVPPHRSLVPVHERARRRSLEVMPTARPTRQNPCRMSEEPSFDAQPPPARRHRRRPGPRASPKQRRVRPLRAPPRQREESSHPPGSATISRSAWINLL